MEPILQVKKEMCDVVIGELEVVRGIKPAEAVV